jgi:SAM-dependent methyltransferase
VNDDYTEKGSSDNAERVAEPAAVGQYELFSLPVLTEPRVMLSERDRLFQRCADKLQVNPALNRALVSFQANKSAPFYRWLKYKEGFSSAFVSFMLERFRPAMTPRPIVLDPFAGSGTTLTAATKTGWDAIGIELLPVGVQAIQARLHADTVDVVAFEHALGRFEQEPYDAEAGAAYRFPHLRITEKAFIPETEAALGAYLAFADSIADEKVRFLFRFAALSSLEDVSFTRKDGQYLRWDQRSGKSLGSHFDKGSVHPFLPTVLSKLRMIAQDIRGRNGGAFASHVQVIVGSCLERLPELPGDSVDLVITSPPYCNRYDYTRTYALELAFLGLDEAKVKTLRQTLLSATVENRSKRASLHQMYEDMAAVARCDAAVAAFETQAALQEVLELLRLARAEKRLNNNNVVTMVENYFLEMSVVIQELARVLAPGGHVVMVNDNVQYVGEEVPVDLILSDFATHAGLGVDRIWVLPKGKGNSSQQMGLHGRNEIRKCVYVWSKPYSQQVTSPYAGT